MEPWYKKKSLSIKRNMVFLQDNAPSHAAKKTVGYLMKVGFKIQRLMKWPACSPDLNPIENPWNILNRKMYEGGRQF